VDLSGVREIDDAVVGSLEGNEVGVENVVAALGEPWNGVAAGLAGAAG